MKTVRFFRLLALRIIVIAAIAMIWNSVTDYLQQVGFFGDTYGFKYSYDEHKSYYKWGARHHIWNAMSFVLLVLSIVRIVVWGNWYWEQEEKEDDVNLKSPENKLF